MPEVDIKKRATAAGKSFVKTCRKWFAKLDKTDDDEVRCGIEDEIHEYPLSIMVRDGWYFPCDDSRNSPEEYQILLATGGPAYRIVGDLGDCCQPASATFQFKDWFKPWTDAELSDQELRVLLRFAQQFSYGE